MVEQLTDEQIAQFREGCALLNAMTPAEYRWRKGEKWERFSLIDKELCWPLGLVGGPSVFETELDGPCPYRPDQGLAIDWPVAQAWRKALIAATGETPRDFSFVFEDDFPGNTP
jgi:hypothetical protein